MKWTDIYSVATTLVDANPDQDSIQLRSVHLRQWVLELPDFDDDPAHCGEKILEAIQMAWIDE